MITADEYNMRLIVWRVRMMGIADGSTIEAVLARDHFRFLNHIHTLIRKTNNPESRVELMEATVKYIEVFVQCDFNVLKAHEILCNRYNYGNEKEETK